MKQWISSLAALILPLIMLIGAIWVFVWAVNRDENGRRAKTWPTAPGVILNAHYSTSGHKNPATMQVIYRYRVGDANFHGDRLNFGFPSPTLERRIRFSIGSVVPVYYDPANPTLACLDPGEDAGETFSAIALSLFFFVYSFPLFLWHCFRIYSRGWKSQMQPRRHFGRDVSRIRLRKISSQRRKGAKVFLGFNP